MRNYSIDTAAEHENNFSIISHLNESTDVTMGHYWPTVSGYYFLTIIILGVVLNGIVLNTFRRNKNLVNNNNQLILFLLGCDSSMLLLSFPFLCVSCLTNEWKFGHFGCQWYGASMTAAGICSIWILTFSAIQRFTSIVLVRKNSSSDTHMLKSLKIVILGIVYSLILSCLPFVGIGSYSLELYVYSCTPTWWARSTSNLIFLSILVISGFFLPIFVIAGCYAGIMFKVYNMPFNSNRRKVIKPALVTFCLIASFLVSWGAYAVTSLLVMFNPGYTVTVLGNIVPVLMAKSCVLWNPIIYTCSNKRFRRELKNDLKDFFCCCCRQKFDQRRNNNDDGIDTQYNETATCNTAEETTKVVQYVKENGTCYTTIHNNQSNGLL